jgi:hypothetical protein
MNIQPVKPEDVASLSKGRTKPAASPPPQPGRPTEDSVRTEEKQKLMEAMRNQPETRPEEVERGRSLAADPEYPSRDVLAEVARKLLQGGSR